MVTDIAVVDVSGGDIPNPLLEGRANDADLVPGTVPGSDPLAEAAELGAPPARREFSEYMDDTDMRFKSASDIVDIGRWFCSSDIAPKDNL